MGTIDPLRVEQLIQQERARATAEMFNREEVCRAIEGTSSQEQRISWLAKRLSDLEAKVAKLEKAGG